MKPTRWPLIAVGSVAALTGLCLLVGRAVLLGTQIVPRDAQGFYTSTNDRLATTSHAIVMPDIDIDTDLDARPGSRIRLEQITSVRITADAGNEAVFAGIARSSDASSYLAGVAHEGGRGLSGRDVVNPCSVRWSHPGTAGRPSVSLKRDSRVVPNLLGRLYLTLTTDAYPPFRLDQGGTQTGPLPPTAPRQALANSARHI